MIGPVSTEQADTPPIKNKRPQMPGKVADNVLGFMHENPHITIADLTLLIGVNDRTIERAIKKLKDQNRLTRIGSRKLGHWHVMQMPESLLHLFSSNRNSYVRDG